MLGDPTRARRSLFRVEVLVVGLVEHDDDFARYAVEKSLDCGREQPGAGGIVRIGDEHHARARGNRLGHRLQVVAIVARRDLDPGCSARLRRQRIHRERVLRVHGVVTRAQKRLRRELEHIVRAVAEHHLLAAHAAEQPPAESRAVTGRERVLQLEAVAVGIAGDIGCRSGNRFAYLATRTAWILIRSQLDDRICRQYILTRELVDWLARHVRCNAADIFRSHGGDSRTGELFGIHREVDRDSSGLHATATGYEPRSFRNGARWRSSASAAATAGSSQ